MIITNARIFSGKKFLIENTIVAEKGRIKDIFFTSGELPDKYAGLEVLDVKGKIVSPGLVDIHTHGSGGLNSIEISKREDISLLKRSYAEEGTTSAVITSFYTDKETSHFKVLSGAVRDRSKGARILGLYLEGPFISKKKKGMINEKYIRTGLNYKKTLKSIYRIAKNIRIMTIAPEVINSKNIIKRIRKIGINAAFGHSDAGYDRVIDGLNNGINHTTHLFNAMNPIHHRNPGPLLAIWEKSKNPVEVIADGMHIKPVVLKMVYELFGKDRIILVTDATGLRGLKDGQHYRKKLGRFILKKGVLFYENHTLMGTNISLLQMCRRMKKWLNLKNEEVLQMATFNPHKMLGDKVGFIKKGYYADFIILDSKLNLLKVIVGGETL